MVMKPAINNIKGDARWWARKNDVPIDETPTTSAISIIVHSTQGLAKKLKPKMGKLVKKTGTAAQCIAQSVEAAIPILSSFMAIFNDLMVAKININATIFHLELFGQVIMRYFWEILTLNQQCCKKKIKGCFWSFGKLPVRLYAGWYGALYPPVHCNF